MIFGVYFPYHKNEFLDTTDEDYDKMPEYPVQFRRVRKYNDKQDAMWAFANTMCPASQLIEAKDDADFYQKVKEMDKNFANQKWLEEHIYPYV